MKLSGQPGQSYKHLNVNRVTNIRGARSPLIVCPVYTYRDYWEFGTNSKSEVRK